MAGRILAYLGAEVIHIEAPTRPDGWRGPANGGHPIRYPSCEPGARPYNRSFMFNSVNPDKLSLCLDLKAPNGLAAMRQLVARSDVVLTNYRPGTLDRLGIGESDARRLNPSIIIVEMPAFGLSGPLAKNLGLGHTMEFTAGMASLVGYADGEPTSTGPAYLDPVGGLHGAAATLTALYARATNGTAQHVEVPQCEAAMQWIGELILAAKSQGWKPFVEGNHVPDAAPHDAFPALGVDNWVAIAVQSDEQWRALCGVIGRPELADDARFAHFADRSRNQSLLEEPLTVWTSRHSKQQAASLLQASGVPAAPVQDGGDVARSAFLEERGFFWELTHADAGTHRYQGLPFHLSRTPGAMRRAAPRLGEDNEQILRDLIGLSADEIVALEDAGTISTSPAG
jgi:crotonobetainyl-CoA:carnitine CoA-transferase CaiB-like acyl-CoA transferase